MTDRLLELAALWGVETHQHPRHNPKALGTWDNPLPLRPRLDIAHDLLAKLPIKACGYSLETVGGGLWEAQRYDDGRWYLLRPVCDFESAVIALCERAGVKL